MCTDGNYKLVLEVKISAPEYVKTGLKKYCAPNMKPKDILYDPEGGDPLKNIDKIDIYGDCKPAIQATKSLNPGKLITNIGHLDYRLYKIRELTERGAVTFKHIYGDGNPADIMTKLVTKKLFVRFSEYILNSSADIGFMSALGN